MLKTIAIFVAWFIAALSIIQLASFLQGKNLVVAFDAAQTEFMQVYYPTNNNNEFTANNTERHAYDAGAIRSVAFHLPNPVPRQIRLDPFDQGGSLKLRDIEIEGLFSKAILTPREVKSRLTARQHVDRVEVLGGALFIHANGIDPIMTLDLTGLAFHYDVLSHIALAILLAAAGYCLFGAPLSRSTRRKVAVFVIPLAITTFITWVFYPGYMTYDSFHALMGARDGVTDSAWPPMVSYVWRAVDYVDSNPSTMLFSQLLLLFASTSVVIFHYTGRAHSVLVALCVTLLIPVILGTIAAIWKDVLMASFFLFSFASALQIKRAHSRGRVIAIALFAIVTLFIATATRHNAITAAVPLVFYVAWLTVQGLGLRRRIASTVLIGAISVACIYGLKMQLDRYALPKLEPIAGVASLEPNVHRMDLIGASICANENLLKDVAPGLTLQEMTAGYDARHVNNSLEVLGKIPPSVDMNAVLWDTLENHPVCFWNNKVQLAKYALGANMGDQFLVVTPQVDSNRFGYYLPSSPIRSGFEEYINNASGWFFFRPWFLYILAMVALVLITYRRNSDKSGYWTLFASGVFYAGGLFLFGNAADARLLFYSNFINIIIFLIVVQTFTWKRQLQGTA